MIEVVWKGALAVGLAGAAVYAGMAGMGFFSQKGLIFQPDQPSRAVTASPDNVGLVYEEVQLATEDGLLLHGWYVPAEQSRGVVLFCHGNAGNISHRLETLQMFHRLRLSVLIFDYRGYGRSQGRISEAGTYRDARAAWHYLVDERGLDPQQVVIFGRSLGGAVAAHLAAERSAGAVILESTFTSVPAMGRSLYPYLPIALMSRYRYPTGRNVATIRQPVLIVHSPDDELIPYDHGRRLFAAANEPKHFLPIKGGHSDGYRVSGAVYTEGVRQFVERYLPGNPIAADSS